MFAWLKSIAAIASFIRWAAETVDKLRRAAAKAKADSRHDKNQMDIDFAFDPVADKLLDRAAKGPGAASFKAPAVPSSTGSSSAVGQGSSDNRERAAKRNRPPEV